MKVVANIDFDGDCREAFTTYAGILGGEIRAMLSHRDMPEMTEGVPEVVNHVRWPHLEGNAITEYRETTNRQGT